MTDWPDAVASNDAFCDWYSRFLQHAETRKLEQVENSRVLRQQLGVTIAQVNHQGVWLND